MLRPIAFVLLIAVSWSALELDGVAAKNWVLLAAGSSGWLNYRHQVFIDELNLTFISSSDQFV